MAGVFASVIFFVYFDYLTYICIEKSIDMKQSVKLSAYSFFITILSLTILIAGMVLQLHNDNETAAYVLAGIIIFICLLSLFYSPLSVSVDDKSLNVIRSLRVKSIPLNEIGSICLFQPTMGERRTCGSGGWFGYWGRFYDRETGRYFAYYGKASDCFLVRLRDGRQYVIGCRNPQTIVDAVNKEISH